MPRVVIGIVGYYAFIRGYPLGPELMARLQSEPWPDGVDIREMNWGPIAIVQDFQSASGTPERVVLVGAVDRNLEHGTVTCRRWSGAALETAEVQRRVFEAVTGVISLDNLLVIGAHFGIWPRQLITVEAQLSENSLSDLLLTEIDAGGASAKGRVIGEQPLTAGNDAIVNRIVSSARRAALDSVESLAELCPLTADQLTPPAKVTHHRFTNGAGAEAGDHRAWS